MFGSVPGFEMTGSGKEKITEIFTAGIYFYSIKQEKKSAYRWRKHRPYIEKFHVGAKEILQAEE
jgi:hypothetical protein